MPLLLLFEVTLFCRVEERVEILKGRVEGRLEPAGSGEGPCALVRAQERMRSKDDSEAGEAFFIDVEGWHGRVVLDELADDGVAYVVE